MARRRISGEHLSVLSLIDDPRYDPVAADREGWWLHTPLLLRFEQRANRLIEVEVSIDDDLAPHPVTVRITGKELPSAREFKELPLASLLRAAVEKAGFPGPNQPAGTRMSRVRKRPYDRGWFGIFRDPKTAANEEGQWAHPKRPNRLTDEFLRLVVELKRYHEDRGDFPKPLIAERYKVHPQTVAKWFQAARSRGFLEKHAPRGARRTQ